MRKAIALFIFSAALSSAADMPWKLWAGSVAVHAVGTSADAYSSWGQTEANRYLCNRNGDFGRRAVSLKIGALAIITGTQYVTLKLTHSKRAAKVFAGVNAVLGVGYTGLAVRNMGVEGRR